MAQRRGRLGEECRDSIQLLLMDGFSTSFLTIVRRAAIFFSIYHSSLTKRRIFAKRSYSSTYCFSLSPERSHLSTQLFCLPRIGFSTDYLALTTTMQVRDKTGALGVG